MYLAEQRSVYLGRELCQRRQLCQRLAVQNLGLWESYVYTLYVRTPHETTCSVAETLGGMKLSGSTYNRDTCRHKYRLYEGVVGDTLTVCRHMYRLYEGVVGDVYLRGIAKCMFWLDPKY